MIDKNDFIKLFVIHNASIGSPFSVVSDAEEYATELERKGYFNPEHEVTPNDFLTSLNKMTEVIDGLQT